MEKKETRLRDKQKIWTCRRHTQRNKRKFISEGELATVAIIAGDYPATIRAKPLSSRRRPPFQPPAASVKPAQTHPKTKSTGRSQHIQAQPRG